MKTLTGDLMPGFYLLSALLIVALVVDQDITIRVLTSVSLKIQVYWINWRMKCQARKLHRQLSADMKEHFDSEMPEFEWVDLWNRDS